MAQLVEHILGKDEVPGPNPGSSSKKTIPRLGYGFFCIYSPVRHGSAPQKRQAESGSLIPRRAVKLACKVQARIFSLVENPGLYKERRGQTDLEEKSSADE